MASLQKRKQVIGSLLYQYDQDQSGTFDDDEIEALCWDLEHRSGSAHALTRKDVEEVVHELQNTKTDVTLQDLWDKLASRDALKVLENYDRALQLYNKYDRDGSGVLEANEFPDFAKELYESFGKKLVGDVMSQYSSFADENGSVTWSSLAQLWEFADLGDVFKSFKEVRALFEKYDVDRSGTIDASELTKLLEAMSSKMDWDASDAEFVQSTLKELDPDGNGEVEWIHFYDWFMKYWYHCMPVSDFVGREVVIEGNAEAKGQASNSIMLPGTDADVSAAEANAKQHGGRYTDDKWGACQGPVRLGDKTFQWKRLSEIVSNPQLFVGGSGEGDIRQGQLGDCWLLSALSTVATRDDLLKKIFKVARPDIGYYVCSFWKFGKWVDVEVDDFVPVTERNRPAFCKSSDENEVWGPVVEKAYAKLHGSYDALIGGHEVHGLEDLTGGVGESISWSTPQERAEIANETLFQRMLQFRQEGWLMGAAVSDSSAAKEAPTSVGLVKNHAYGVLDVRQVGDLQFVKLRNPWGQGEFNGDWSDSSPLWQKHPEVAKALEFTEADDGVFHMIFADFVAYYNHLDVLRLYDDAIGEAHHRSSVHGEWSGASAGGCAMHATWVDNPMYRINTDGLKEATSVFVYMAQPDVRVTVDDDAYLAIGFYVMRSPVKNRRVLAFDQKAVYAKSKTFMFGRSTSLEITLAPGEEYVLVPCSFKPQEAREFEVALYCTTELPLEPLEPLPCRTIAGEWTAKTAVGFGHPYNPQLRISVSVDDTYHIELARPETAEKIGLCFFLYESAKRVLDARSSIARSQYIASYKVSADFELAAGKSYVLMPCVQKPDVTGPFSFNVHTQHEIEHEELPL